MGMDDIILLHNNINTSKCMMCLARKPQLVVFFILILFVLSGCQNSDYKIEKATMRSSYKTNQKQEAEESSDQNYYVSKNLGVKFEKWSTGISEAGNIIADQYYLSGSAAAKNNYIAVFNKERDKDIVESINLLIKNEGNDPRNWPKSSVATG